MALYLKVAKNSEIARGQVFNIERRIENSLSLLELFDILESELGIRLNYENLPPRKSDQKVFVADTTKISDLVSLETQSGQPHRHTANA